MSLLQNINKTQEANEVKTTLKEYSAREICEGFQYNELEGKGLFGLAGRLTIQPEYQRNYIYADGKRDVAAIDAFPTPSYALASAIFSCSHPVKR